MSRPKTSAVAVFALAVTCAAASAAAEPPRSTIVSMAQHFVQDYYMQRGPGHYHIEFDLAYLHPQPEPGFWAVVGGFMSGQSTPNEYVVAIRQICEDYATLDCWRMEKLAINRQIILNLGEPL